MARSATTTRFTKRPTAVARGQQRMLAFSGSEKSCRQATATTSNVQIMWQPTRVLKNKHAQSDLLLLYFFTSVFIWEGTVYSRFMRAFLSLAVIAECAFLSWMFDVFTNKPLRWKMFCVDDTRCKCDALQVENNDYWTPGHRSSMPSVEMQKQIDNGLEERTIYCSFFQ